jgi:carnosine N-methyltransferase
VGGRIPILLQDPRRYLAAFAIHCARDLAAREAEADALRRQIDEGHPRAEVLARLQAAAEQANRFLGDVRDLAVRAISVEDLMAVIVRPPPPMQYSATLDYLHRDWCWLPEAEAELARIEAALFAGLRSSGRRSPGAALVLGAGAGRIAWDMGGFFDHVFATDSSLMMAHQFQSVLAGDFESCALASTNARTGDDMVKGLRASIMPPERADSALVEERRKRMTYFVSDALDVPLASASVAAIASVYFTDLVPLEPLLGEVGRLLEPGGVFVHFGPLDYHFPDMAHHLSADEIKARFAAEGFIIRSEATVATRHLSFRSAMSVRLYDNWLFVAERQ